MTSLDDDEAFSGDDADADFQDDMESLRQACLISGVSLDSAMADGEDVVPREQIRSFTTSSTSASVSASATRDGDSESEDDLELLRKVQRRFIDSVDSCEAALYLNPPSVGPQAFDDDEMDDFETLCAVRNRFAAYEVNKLEDVLSESGSDANLRSEPFVEQKDVDGAKGRELVPGYSSFPMEAQLLVDAIKRNRSCQKFLRSKIAHIEVIMEENRQLVARVKILKDFQVRCKRIAGDAFSIEQDPRIQLITAQKPLSCKDSKLSAKCKGPVENSHVAKYRLAVPHSPLSWKQKPWSKVERENLNKGLKRLFKEALLQASVDQSSESEGSPRVPSNLNDVASSIRNLDITPERIREFIPRVNWEQLASLYVPGRSGAECEARWLNFEDPLINKNPWTKQEEKLILLIVQEKGMTNWIDIATSLGTNRTPFDCLAHFQRSLNANILKREWTSEEDDQLGAAVQMFGEGNWQSVAANLPGRTGTQCSNRWLKSIHPSNSRKGRWTTDEDKRLKVAVKLFGPKNWEKIAQFVPGRTQSQCRDRWVNNLDPSLKRGEWTEEEDSKLKAGIEEFGHCWSKIAAKYLPHRTDNLCLRRWKVLFPEDVVLAQAARRTKKAALRNNFVDYEVDRPALGLSDFIPLPMITSGTDPQKTVRVPAKRCKRKSREPNGSTGEKNDDEHVQGKGKRKLKPRGSTKSVEVSCEESLAVVPSTEIENMGTLDVMPILVAEDVNAETCPFTIRNDVAPRKGKRKLRPRRRTKNVEVSKEESLAVVPLSETDSMGSPNVMPILVAEDVNAAPCPSTIQNGFSDNTFSHHSCPMQTTQENAGELSLVHLISCEPVNLEQHEPQALTSKDCGHDPKKMNCILHPSSGADIQQQHDEGDDHEKSCDPGVANATFFNAMTKSDTVDPSDRYTGRHYTRRTCLVEVQPNQEADSGTSKLT